MSKFTYGDLPDDLVTKKLWTLGRHLWTVARELGYNYIVEKMDLAVDKVTYDAFKIRLDNAIQTAKAVIENKIKNPERVPAFSLFPPGNIIRADLQQGSMKLLYGESCDVVTLSVRDDINEAFLITNCHLEDGIPVDWWLIGHSDELFDRRHLKLGYKLRDMPKYSKNLTELGFRVQDILKDVRNERTPQWSSSPMIILVNWIMMSWNFIWEISSWEVYASLFDGLVAKKLYGMPDNAYAYVPFPPLINPMLYMGRKAFTLRFAGLMTGHYLCWHGMEPEIYEVINQDWPEYTQILIERNRKIIGCPYPVQTINCQLPDYKNEKIFEKNETLNWKYPEGEWIKLEHLGMSYEEQFDYIFMDITHDVTSGQTPEFIQDHIICTHIGKDAIMRK
ncbi:MAG: hypothetical protein ACTSO9_21380 [Candidatus Helarchaeota archaeon]